MRDFTFTISDKEGPVVFLASKFRSTYRYIDSVDRRRIEKGIDDLCKYIGIPDSTENEELRQELDAKDQVIAELREIIGNLPSDMAEIEKRWTK